MFEKTLLSKGHSALKGKPLDENGGVQLSAFDPHNKNQAGKPLWQAAFDDFMNAPHENKLIVMWKAAFEQGKKSFADNEPENLSIPALLAEITLLKSLLREAYPSVLTDAESDHDHYESKEMLRDLAKRINDQVAQ